MPFSEEKFFDEVIDFSENVTQIEGKLFCLGLILCSNIYFLLILAGK